MREFRVGERLITEESKPFTIAEIGVNHYDIAKNIGTDPLSAAKIMIDVAANSGADSVKFQTYKADKIASKNSPGYWDKTKEAANSQYELFCRYDMFDELDYKALAEHCYKRGVVFLSTPFDFDSADFLEKLMPIYKISSSDITNEPFLEHIASKGKPILLSTGASTIEEIDRALSTIIRAGVNEVALMHCILNYPTNYRDANLLMIRDLIEKFQENIIGYSDHTLPDQNMVVLTSAINLGARIVEKHFTLDKSLPGNDHYHSMDGDDLKTLNQNIELVWQVYGNKDKEPLSSEFDSRLFARRSIVASQDIEKGSRITREHLCYKRPGTGIEPFRINEVLDRIAAKKIRADELIDLNSLM